MYQNERRRTEVGSRQLRPKWTEAEMPFVNQPYLFEIFSTDKDIMSQVIRIQSKSVMTRSWLLGFCAIVPGVLLFGLSPAQHFALSKGTAPFLLGIGLIGLGIVVIFFNRKAWIEVDPVRRQVRVVVQTRFDTKVRSVDFDKIAAIKCSGIGNKFKNGFQTYYLKFELRDGKTVDAGYVTNSEDDANSTASTLAELSNSENQVKLRA